MTATQRTSSGAAAAPVAAAALWGTTGTAQALGPDDSDPTSVAPCASPSVRWPCLFLGVARTGVAVGAVIAPGITPLATGLLGLLGCPSANG